MRLSRVELDLGRRARSRIGLALLDRLDAEQPPDRPLEHLRELEDLELARKLAELDPLRVDVPGARRGEHPELPLRGSSGLAPEVRPQSLRGLVRDAGDDEQAGRELVEVERRGDALTRAEERDRLVDQRLEDRDPLRSLRVPEQREVEDPRSRKDDRLSRAEVHGRRLDVVPESAVLLGPRVDVRAADGRDLEEGPGAVLVLRNEFESAGVPLEKVGQDRRPHLLPHPLVGGRSPEPVALVRADQERRLVVRLRRIDQRDDVPIRRCNAANDGVDGSADVRHADVEVVALLSGEEPDGRRDEGRRARQDAAAEDGRRVVGEPSELVDRTLRRHADPFQRHAAPGAERERSRRRRTDPERSRAGEEPEGASGHGAERSTPAADRPPLT